MGSCLKIFTRSCTLNFHNLQEILSASQSLLKINTVTTWMPFNISLEQPFSVLDQLLWLGIYRSKYNESQSNNLFGKTKQKEQSVQFGKI